MPQLIIAYHGGTQSASPEEGAKHGGRFMKWMSGLGDAVVNPGTPLGMSKTLRSEGVSDTGSADGLTGFSIITADNLEAAVAVAQGCPFLEMGTLEVAQVMQIK